jgi:hypothetical protein
MPGGAVQFVADGGRWEVQCPACQAAAPEVAPLGIGMTISGELEAQLIKDNHIRSFIRRVS